MSYNQLQKSTWDTTVFWHKWPVHDLVLLIPPPPPIKVASNKGHTQNLEEQLWMGGRREVSIISHRPMTRSDLNQERSFFRGSVSTFLQLVVAFLLIERSPYLDWFRSTCHAEITPMVNVVEAPSSMLSIDRWDFVSSAKRATDFEDATSGRSFTYMRKRMDQVLILAAHLVIHGEI